MQLVGVFMWFGFFFKAKSAEVDALSTSLLDAEKPSFLSAEYVSLSQHAENDQSKYRELYNRVVANWCAQDKKKNQNQNEEFDKTTENKKAMLESCLAVLRNQVDAPLANLIQCFEKLRKENGLKPDGWFVRSSTTEALVAEVICFVNEQKQCQLSSQ